MSNQPLQLEQPSGLEIDSSTFHCPTCGAEILSINQLTHEVACARLHRQNRSQAPGAGQSIVRQSSSSAIPEPLNNVQRLPSVRREERRLAENKLVNCPNCEQSVREQELANHLDHECLDKELIPCEFCENTIPMSQYNDHVENCEMRRQNDRNEEQQQDQNESDHQSEHHPEEEEEHKEDESDLPQSPSAQRENSSEDHGSSQQSSGGFRGFLRNLASTAGNILQEQWKNLTTLPERPESQQEEPNRLSGLRANPFMVHPSNENPFMQNQNALVPYNRPVATRRVRTIEMGPDGNFIIRTRTIPVREPQLLHPMMGNPMNEMGSFGMLMNMINGGHPGGMQMVRYGDLENMQNVENGGQEESGLSKEVIESLAVVKYNPEASKNASSETKSCPICLDDYEAGQETKFLWCMHRFHKGCIDQWLDKHTNCPICKKDFSEADQGFSP